MEKLKKVEDLKKTYAYKLAKDAWEEKTNEPFEELHEDLQYYLIFWITFNAAKLMIEEYCKRKAARTFQDS